MKILMIIAEKDFRDEEFKVPYHYFKKNNVAVDIASTKKGDCFGKFGHIVASDLVLEDAIIQEYFAVVIVGGPGAKTLKGNKALENIVLGAIKQNIVISAICISPTLLAQFGVLNGKKVTVWNGDGKQKDLIESLGAEYVDDDVVVDGLIVTANGPDSAKKFAEKVLEITQCEKCWIKE